MDLPKIAILIPAAGSSRRMGSPKQLLKWGTTTLLGHCINQALNSVADDVFVILGAHYDQISNQIDQTSSNILINKDWNLGLGSSIACGVQHILMAKLKVDGVLIMLADQPQFDSDYVNSLIKPFRKNDKCIVATTYGEQIGVPVIFDSYYFNQLSTLNSDQGAKEIINENIAYVATIIPQSKIIDIDTQENYEQLYKQMHKQ